MYAGLIERVVHVQLGPDFAFGALRKDIVNPRKQVAIGYSVGVVERPSRLRSDAGLIHYLTKARTYTLFDGFRGAVMDLAVGTG